MKKYTRPAVVKSEKRVAAAKVCCGMGSTATCSINRARIS